MEQIRPLTSLSPELRDAEIRELYAVNSAVKAERDRLLDAAQVALAWSDPDWVGYETVKSAVDAALGQEET